MKTGHMAKQGKGYRIQFTTSRGRDELTLPNLVEESVYKETKRLTLLLARRERFGSSLSVRDSQVVESYHSFVREKWIARGLIESKPDEVVPTLGVFLTEYYKGGFVPSEAHRRRLRSYLTEYFGEGKRIDLITPVEAAGIRHFLENERKKPKGKRGGCLATATINRAVQMMKSCFRTAVDWGYLKASPFAKVKGGKVANEKTRYYVHPTEWQTAVDSVENVELRGIMAFARYAGCRVPCEIREMKFTDFDFFPNGSGCFRISQEGKTRERLVPFFQELRPYFDALRSAASSKDVYVFPKYRQCKNVGELIKKSMRRAGLEPWRAFMNNMRRSSIWDKLTAGFSMPDLTATFGNSEDVRQEHYYFTRDKEAVAALGGVSGVQEGAEKVPSDFPSFDLSYWVSFDDGTSNFDLALRLCEHAGLPTDESRKMLEKDGRIDVFGKSLKALRRSIYNYVEGRISYAGLLMRVAAFISRAAYEFVREVFTPPTLAAVVNGRYGTRTCDP